MRLIGLLAAIGATAAVGVDVLAATDTGPPACAATPVRYLSAKHPTLDDAPWVLAKPAAAGVVAFVPSYPRALRDGRVNRSDGLVVWKTGGKIVWHVRGVLDASVVAQRLDGRGSFRLPLSARADGLSSTPRFSAAGCWRLTFRTGKTEASVVARVIPNPSNLGCDATPIGEASLAIARPRSAGIAGGWTWRTRDSRTLMYTHGVGPGALNAKVPWWIRREWGASLELTGIRLDGAGRFAQEFSAAGDPSSRPPGYQAVFPSIVDVPAAGCWLFRLRTANLAGVLVVRAVDR